MKLILPSVVFLTMVFASFAQSGEPAVHKWSFEADVVQPFIPTVGIFNIQATRNVFTGNSQKGDLLLGVYLRPNVKHDIVEEIDEYMLYIAYRHFLWKGLHLEAGMNTGYYWGWNNLVNGRDYEGVGMYWETNIGYKLELGKSKRFFINPQAGFIGTMGLSDIGPRQGKSDNFVQGNLLLGLNF